jgi:hypothetical protein
VTAGPAVTVRQVRHAACVTAGKEADPHSSEDGGPLHIKEEPAMTVTAESATMAGIDLDPNEAEPAGTTPEQSEVQLLAALLAQAFVAAPLFA